MTDTNKDFTPDWALIPGESILDAMEERGWTQAQLAERLGYKEEKVGDLINGEISITNDVAIRLANALGGTADFWLNLESNYQKHKARLQSQALLSEWTEWLPELPIKPLMECGAITKVRMDSKNKPAIVADVLRFFGVASPQEWKHHYGNMQVAFRKSANTNTGAISAWLRLGEHQAEKISHLKYDKEHFENVLNQIRSLTIEKPEIFEPEMRRLLQESGVAFLLVPSVAGAKVSGAARWLSPTRPVIQLSLYGKTNDKFWFSFFHEAAHILLHSESESVFLDDTESPSAYSKQEQEANDWAKDFLIPSTYNDELYNLRSKEKICAFAESIGIHPAIVVGRLQHEKIIQMSWCNDLKQRFVFTD